MTSKVTLTPEYRLRRMLRIGFKDPVERAQAFTLLSQVIENARKEGSNSGVKPSGRRHTEGGE